MSKFKVGDKVKAIASSGWFREGCIYTVTGVKGGWVGAVDSSGEPNGWSENNFELANEGPVREVKRLEIVPGRYGIVWVNNRDGNLNIFSEDYSSAELRAASAILSEIANALDNKGDGE